MAAILIEGFDKYVDTSFLTLGEWTTVDGLAIVNFVAGPYSSGALQIFGTNTVGQADSHVNRTLPNNYSTLIVGVRMHSALAPSYVGFQLCDGNTSQIELQLNTLGQFVLLRDSTVLYTSTASVTANTWHYVEVKVTFSTTVGQYALWLDGVNLVTSAANQNTSASGSNSANVFRLLVGASTTAIFDDLYIFDDSGTVNNTIAGDSVVETQHPTADSAVQFSIGAAALGTYYTNGSTVSMPVSQGIFLRSFTPESNCSLSSISILPAATNASAHFKFLIFADSGGLPGALLTSSAEVTGCVTDTPLSGNLLVAQSLIAGTSYWFGWMQDTSIEQYRSYGNANSGYYANYTYASGAPGSAPVMTPGAAPWTLWGTITTTTNFTEVRNVDEVPDTSLRNYISSSVVGDEDLYVFPALVSTPVSVSAVKVSAFCQKSDSGHRGLDMRVKSGGVDAAGNSPDNSLTSTFEYVSSIFDTDPATGVAWTGTGINAAISGVKVSS